MCGCGFGTVVVVQFATQSLGVIAEELQLQFAIEAQGSIDLFVCSTNHVAGDGVGFLSSNFW